MILKKVRFPFLVFALLIAMVFSSCNKNKRELKGSANYIKFKEKGVDLYDEGKLDSAYNYFTKAYLECKEEEKKNKIFVLIYMMFIQNAQGDYSGSEAKGIEALKIDNKNEYLTNIYNGLGLSYQEQKDFQNSLKYYNKSLQIAKTEIDKCIIKNNIGYAFLELHRYKDAEAVLMPLSKNDSLIASKNDYARVLDNLGFAYFKVKNPIAIDYLNQSLKIRDSLNNDSERIASLMHLAEYYQHNDTIKSNDFAQKAYNAATNINSPDDRIEALSFLSENPNLNLNQIKKLYQKRMRLSDSISEVRQTAKNQFANLKYNNEIIIKDNQKQKSQKQLYLVLFLLVTVISLGLYFLIRSKNKRKLQKVTYETETRISKKLHDELANDVFNAMTFAETQDLQNLDKKEFLLDNLDTIYTRTRNIAKENSDIETGEEFSTYLQGMISSYITNEVNVITQNSNAINWSKVKKETKIAIYRVVQELLVNMKKHSQCSIVIIGFETKKNHLEITYSDNGIGTSEMLKFKNGLQNAENRILAINGTLTFETESGKGFKAKIIFSK